MEKIKNGQFYTLRSPFEHPLVQEWFKKIPNIKNKTFAEPFAGANNIVKSVLEAYPEIQAKQWKCYDISPEAIRKNEVPEIQLIQQNTLMNFPESDVVITNPPYLAKNSATRMKIATDYNYGIYQDVYEIAIEKMLDNAEYVAAIIPESFLTRKFFKNRLFGFVSITDKLFDDTDFPVGIALWNPESTKDFTVWVGMENIGNYSKIVEETELFKVDDNDLKKVSIKYNSPYGIIGLKAVDNTVKASIEYVKGTIIDPTNVKVSSRAITRLDVLDKEGSSLVDENNLPIFLKTLNEVLDEYRHQSSDVFLTSFKGLRKDLRYRRRMDWKTSSKIIYVALTRLQLLDKSPQKTSPATLFDI